MILPLRTRLAIATAVLALAGVAAVVLAPKVEHAVHQVEQMARSPHGLAGSAVQALLNPQKRRPATPVAHHAGGGARAGAPPRRAGAGSRPAAHRRAAAARTSAGARAPAAGSSAPWGLVIGMLAVLLAVVPLSGCSRLWCRLRRCYRAYPILPSGHDQPSARQVVAAVGTIGETISEPLHVRVWRGQPAFGIQLDYDPDRGGRVIPLLVCEPRQVRALDAALRQAYPNVRVGCEFKPPRTSSGDRCWRPRAVWRLRKSSDPIYPLYDTVAEEDLGPPLEAAATSLHGLGEGERTHAAGRFGSLRVMVLPSRRTAAYLRDRHRRKERKDRLGQQIAHGQHAPASSVDSQQARQSVQLSEHAVFHAEVQIAADGAQTCKRLAGALLRYPGMNTLRQRNMTMREGLYRRRWETFAPPLLMRGSAKVMSASELGYLIRLPSADLTVPIERAREPRRAAGQSEGRNGERDAPLPIRAARRDGEKQGRVPSGNGGCPTVREAIPGAAGEGAGVLEPRAAGNGAGDNGDPAGGASRPVVIVEEQGQEGGA